MPRAAYLKRGVGKRIRLLRREQGLSQRRLASDGVTNAYISRVESGDRTPSIEALIAIAEKLDTTALRLMTGKADAVCPVCGRH